MGRVTVGSVVVGIGVLHNVVGVLATWPHLVELVQEGWFGTVPDDAPWRMATFWFLWFGWMLMLLGGSWHVAERRGMVIPGWLGVAFVVMGMVGAAAMPVSGFWTVLPVGAMIWWRSQARPA